MTTLGGHVTVRPCGFISSKARAVPKRPHLGGLHEGNPLAFDDRSVAVDVVVDSAVDIVVDLSFDLSLSLAWAAWSLLFEEPPRQPMLGPRLCWGKPGRGSGASSEMGILALLGWKKEASRVVLA